MKLLFKVLFISVLYGTICGCKANYNKKDKKKLERTDTTDDIRDEQMEDYEMEMMQQRNN
jgi:hypothetical protein